MSSNVNRGARTHACRAGTHAGTFTRRTFLATPALLANSAQWKLHLSTSSRAMIDAGLAVVLATDFNPGSSPTPSMTMILSLAATHMNVTPAEAITAATINAAYSLGRGDRRDHRELAYFFGIEHAESTHKGGVCVFKR